MGAFFDLLVEYGYLIVFLAAMAEALPLLGWLVPGQAIIIAAGAAAALGYFDIWLLMLVTLPAGILGDALGYYLGRYYGRSFLERYGRRLRITPKHLERSDALFRRYGPFALIVARFSFLTRAIGPLLGGISKMRARVFWPINILGAILWSVSYTLLGFFGGVSFRILQGTVGKILAWTLVGVVALYLFYRLLHKYADQFTRDDLYVAIMGSGAGAIFGIIADQVHKRGGANGIDAVQPAILTALRPGWSFFRVIETATSFQVLGAVSLGLLIVLFARRRWWDATLVGLGMGGIIVVVESLRPLFAGSLPAGSSAGFPSTNAAVAIVFGGVLTYMIAMRATWVGARMLAAVGAALLAGLALFSRVAQAEELPSAALAGLALGAAWLAVTVLVVEFRLKRNPRPPGREASPGELPSER